MQYMWGEGLNQRAKGRKSLMCGDTERKIALKHKMYVGISIS